MMYVAHRSGIASFLFTRASSRYAKMQMQALPGSASTLKLDDIIVPKARKVAAEGFYHCLGKFGIVKCVVSG
jgi:hypothetical protein